MKKKNLLPLALAALMLGACSSDKLDDPGTNGNGSGFNSEGKGYLSVSINLPTGTNSMAAHAKSRANDQYDDGVAAEYQVNNAYLYLFKKGTATTESGYQYVAKYDLSGDFTAVADGDAITTHKTVTVKVSQDETESTDLHGLVILNNNLLDASDANKIHGLSLTTGDNATTFETLVKQTVTQATTVENLIGSTKNSFLMTNAVLVNQPGSAALSSPTVQTLVPLSGKIKPTESEAEAVATDFFVERAVAKVNVKASDASSIPTSIAPTDITTTITAAFGGWDLGNTNTKTYLVRNWGLVDGSIGDTPDYTKNVGNSWLSLTSSTSANGSGATAAQTANPYRFAGITLQKESESYPESNWYRTYFGYDPNFTGKTDLQACQSNFSTDAKFCLENTFDVEHQSIENTTCAIIKVTFTLPTDNGKSGGDKITYSWSDGSNSTTSVFYTLNNDKTQIYDYNAITNKFADRAQTLYEQELKAKVEASMTASNDGDGTTDTYTYKLTSPTVDFTLDTKTNEKSVSKSSSTGVKWTVEYYKSGSTTAETSAPTGFLSMVSLSDIATGTSDTDKSTDLQNKIEAINSSIKAYQYTDATAYYRVPIKHFGDDLTPWTRGSKTTSYIEPNETVYNHANYLGRYGVLRNNSYELEIESVKQIGSATVPDITGETTWDDEIENYLSVKVNVLSWAKRTQGVTLQ